MSSQPRRLDDAAAWTMQAAAWMMQQHEWTMQQRGRCSSMNHAAAWTMQQPSSAAALESCQGDYGAESTLKTCRGWDLTSWNNGSRGKHCFLRRGSSRPVYAASSPSDFLQSQFPVHWKVPHTLRMVLTTIITHHCPPHVNLL